MAMDSQAGAPPPVEIIDAATAIRRDAIQRIRSAYDEVSRCYGFDRFDAGERVKETYPPIGLAVVQRLEWGAGKLLDNGKPATGANPRRRGKNRGVRTRKPSPPTARQLEVIQTVADCRGNIAEAARRLGRDRKAIEESYKAGMEKAGKVVYHSKDKTQLLTRDRRGQENVADGDDRRRQ
jgi:hypothetical protein